MNKSVLYKTLTATGLGLALGLAVAFAYTYISNLDKVTEIEALFVINPEDDRQLVGFADNVFLGRVSALAGTHYEPDNVVPWTLFQVQVTENIKGSLPETVTVGQEGGFSIEEGRTMMFFGDQLLAPGQEYLFVTRFYEQGPWHTVFPVYGDLRIDNSRHERELIDRFTQALAEEVPFQS